LEAKRRKLNELGSESLAQGIPLAENKALQERSQQVDQLIIQLHEKKAGRG